MRTRTAGRTSVPVVLYTATDRICHSYKYFYKSSRTSTCTVSEHELLQYYNMDLLGKKQDRGTANRSFKRTSGSVKGIQPGHTIIIPRARDALRLAGYARLQGQLLTLMLMPTPRHHMMTNNAVLNFDVYICTARMCCWGSRAILLLQYRLLMHMRVTTQVASDANHCNNFLPPNPRIRSEENVIQGNEYNVSSRCCAARILYL